MKTFLSEKQTAFKSIILLMLVMFTGLMADAQKSTTAKQKPFIYIGLNGKEGYGDASKGEKATYLNDTKFIEPAIIVYENDNKQTLVTNRFYLSYYLTSETADGTKGTNKVEKGETWNVDEATGTRVNTRYGDIETGHSAGVVYVHVKAVPSDRYTNMFEEAEATYRITLNKVQAQTPVRVVPEFVTDETYRNGWYAATGTTISLPKFKINYVTTDNNGKTLDVDITKRFSVTATVMDESKGLATVASYDYNSLEKGNEKLNATVISTDNTAGVAKIRFSFKPLYDNAYNNIDDVVLDLNIVDEKVSPKLIFANAKQLAYTGMQNIAMQRPTVYDQFGNDITPTVSYTDCNKPLWIAWSVAPLAAGKTMHTPNGWLTPLMSEQGTQTPPENITVFWNAGVTAYGPDNLNSGDVPFQTGVRRNEFVACDMSSRDAAMKTCKLGSYSVNVYCQVYPNAYNEIAKAKYNASEDKYEFEIKPRPVKIMLTPSVKDVNITKDTKINMQNRFEVIGVYVPEIDDTKLNKDKG